MATVVDILSYAKKVAARAGATSAQRRHAANIADRRRQVLGYRTPMLPGGIGA